MTTEATAIRDAIFTRLSTLPGYVQFAKTPVPTVSHEDVPRLAVFLLNEQMEPDGDYNAGEPRFISTATIGISVIRGFDDPITLEGAIDSDVDTIENLLLSDTTFVNFGPNCLFEGVTGMRRQRLFPQDGETYYAELRLEMDFLFRVSFEPNVSDVFTRHVVTPVPAFPT